MALTDIERKVLAALDEQGIISALFSLGVNRSTY